MIAAIHGYRRVAKMTGFRRNCLFGVSCSRHVEAIARERGGRAAIRAMRVRFANCRPGYSFEFEDDSWHIECVGGMRVAAEDASVHVHREAIALLAVLR